MKEFGDELNKWFGIKQPSTVLFETSKDVSIKERIMPDSMMLIEKIFGEIIIQTENKDKNIWQMLKITI